MTDSTYSPSRHLLVLAPSSFVVPPSFKNVIVDERRQKSLLADMQRLRGKVYLDDEAITRSELSADGRHHTSIDDQSWHLLTVNRHGSISGCARYTEYDNSITFQQLNVSKSALSHSDQWGSRLEQAITTDIEAARAEGIGFVEVGGWALAREHRFTTEALQIALATFALGRLLGGCLGIATATVRNSSASILRRLGGHSFLWNALEVPEYYDPQYNCQMELLRFHSNLINSKYSAWLNEIGIDVACAPVICSPSTTASRIGSIAGESIVERSVRAAWGSQPKTSIELVM